MHRLHAIDPIAVAAASASKIQPSNATRRHKRLRSNGFFGLRLVLACAAAIVCAAHAAAQKGFLETIHRHTTLASTVPTNGDQNPYAIAVAPVSAGAIKQGDVLVDNFNDRNNLQGLGTTIVDINPSTMTMRVFAMIPRHLPQCPGGIGLTTAMTMLKSGWVIVGSLPSRDGTTTTKGQGCLLVLDAKGKLAKVFADPNINGPWGNMAVVDTGARATLFISNTGFAVGAPSDDAPVIRKATVLRLDLTLTPGKPPAVSGERVIGEGFGEQADKGVFVIGPTGLALGADGTLYVSDAIGNRITAIADAATRATSAGTGREVTKDGLLKRPLALAMTPSGHLLAANGLNGQVVEIDPKTGHQLGAQWIDADKAQTPPGNGDLFGLALTPDGDGLYYVEDDMNTLVLAR